MRKEEKEVVGLIPAAGQAKRIAPLPMSKELYPVGFQRYDFDNAPRPKVVSHYLLEKFKYAGISKTFIVIREGKWDIPGYFGDGSFLNMHLGYLVMRQSFGPAFTLDQAYPFLHDKVAAFGFPDIIFSPQNAFKQLLEFQYRETNESHVVLGLFPAHDFRVTDMVDMDENGKIHNILINPVETDLRFTWLCGVWTPHFTHFMHEYVQTYRIDNSLQNVAGDTSKQGDLTVGAVLKAAITKGLNVYGVPFPNGKYLDIGTPDNLMKSIELYGCQIS